MSLNRAERASASRYGVNESLSFWRFRLTASRTTAF